MARINLVLDYIETNMNKDLSLSKLSEIANFSPYHFHRIFSAIVGETLNQYMQRIRIEKAATQLINNPKKSITEIAYDCGFSSSATFSREFRETFNISATEWRSGGCFRNRKNCKTESKGSQTHSNIRKETDFSSYYTDGITQNHVGRMIDMKNEKQVQVEVKDIPDFHVVYLRYIGPYKGDVQLFEGLFGKLMRWAGPRGLLNFPETRVLTVYHDNPEITDEDNLRISVCITAPEDTPVDGEIGKIIIPGGKYAFARFEIATEEYQEAWNMVCSLWLPESGYQPDDRPCFELCHNNYKEHPEQKHIIDICIPVKPL